MIVLNLILIGDFFANLSLARKGIGEMALAGCYGSPIFDILVGLGMSFVYVTSKHYPEQYAIEVSIYYHHLLVI